MTDYTTQSLVLVSPFTRQIEGEEVVIGIPDRDVFLVLPRDAVELLDYLSEGKTIDEAKLIYQDKYGEIPDLEDLLQGLERRGLVKPIADNYLYSSSSIGSTYYPKSRIKRYHFANFPQSLAQKIFSIPMLTGWGFIIGLAIALAIAEPAIVPTWKAYFFQENMSLMVLVMMAMDGITLFLHEMAHLIAARSVGVFSRLGISNRMWTIVAQTDMTGIWNVPRNKRYLPLLAGSLFDLTIASILTIVLYLLHRGWLTVAPVGGQLLQACLLNYLMGLLWQCYFFMRTDFYYIFGNWFGCKNLLQDTEIFIGNQISRIIPQIQWQDRSHIPYKERKVIQSYAVLWLLGRTVAIGTLIFINLPLICQYCWSLLTKLSAGYSAHPYAFIDALLLLTIFLLTQGLGMGMWIGSFWKKSRFMRS